MAELRFQTTLNLDYETALEKVAVAHERLQRVAESLAKFA